MGLGSGWSQRPEQEAARYSQRYSGDNERHRHSTDLSLQANGHCYVALYCRHATSGDPLGHAVTRFEYLEQVGQQHVPRQRFLWLQLSDGF